jgi:hypothetical protein
MDLYSTDGADISEGSMRHSQMEQIARNYQAHNDALIGRLAQKQSNLAGQVGQLRESDYIAGAKNTIEGVIHSHALYNGMNTLNQWTGARADARKTLEDQRTNLIQGGDGALPEPVLRNESSVTTAINRPEGANAGSTNGDIAEHENITAGAKDDAKSSGLFSEGTEGKLAKFSKTAKVLGSVTGLATAGASIYEDFKDNRNGWEKAGDILSGVGSLAEVGGIALPPLEVVGAVTSLIGAGIDEIGELFESGKERKEKQAQEKEAQEQQQKAEEETRPITTTASAPQVALSRTQ